MFENPPVKRRTSIFVHFLYNPIRERRHFGVHAWISRHAAFFRPVRNNAHQVELVVRENHHGTSGIALKQRRPLKTFVVRASYARTTNKRNVPDTNLCHPARIRRISPCRRLVRFSRWRTLVYIAWDSSPALEPPSEW